MEIKTSAAIVNKWNILAQGIYSEKEASDFAGKLWFAADELAKELEEQRKAIVDFIDAVDRLSKFEEIPDEALESLQTEEIEVSYTLEKIDELIEKLREGTK